MFAGGIEGKYGCCIRLSLQWPTYVYRVSAIYSRGLWTPHFRQEQGRSPTRSGKVLSVTRFKEANDCSNRGRGASLVGRHPGGGPTSVEPGDGRRQAVADRARWTARTGQETGLYRP